MKLSDIEINVGVVIDSDDPKHEGRVKISCPDMFDEETMDPDYIFWANPIMSDFQKFTHLDKGNKVWMLHNPNNYYEYYYLPYFELNSNTKALIDNKDLDVLVSRSASTGDAQLYYKQDEGLVNKVGNGHMTVNKDSDIDIHGAKKVDVTGNVIKIGKENGSYEPAVMGDKLQRLLSGLASDLQTLSLKCAAVPYTASLASSFMKMSTSITSKIPEILSDTVKISK